MQHCGRQDETCCDEQRPKQQALRHKGDDRTLLRAVGMGRIDGRRALLCWPAAL